MENHVRIGGLGSAVAEMMADNGVKRLVRIGIDDTYSQRRQFAVLDAKTRN